MIELFLTKKNLGLEPRLVNFGVGILIELVVEKFVAHREFIMSPKISFCQILFATNKNQKL